VAGADLELAVGGRSLRFPAVWLRDNCPCEAKDPAVTPPPFAHFAPLLTGLLKEGQLRPGESGTGR
jgi:hypothetical protein